jgi:uncharacterized membrane protein YuzA (DUF378 family)
VVHTTFLRLVDFTFTQIELHYIQLQEVTMKVVDVLAGVLVVVGALNWGLVSIARFDLVAALFGLSFGQVSAATALVYGLVGIAGLYHALSWTGVLAPAGRHA